MFPLFIVQVEDVTLHKCLIGFSTDSVYIISTLTESVHLLIYVVAAKAPSAIEAVPTEVANDDFTMSMIF